MKMRKVFHLIENKSPHFYQLTKELLVDFILYEVSLDSLKKLYACAYVYVGI